MTKKLSVVIPAKNEENYIGKTLANAANVLDALKIDYEIIVADNGSTDTTAKIAQGHKCKIAHNLDPSIAKTRNAGAKLAEGDFILFIDADTIISESLMAKALAEIEKPRNKAVLCLTSFDKYPTLGSLGVWFYNIFSYIFKLGAGHFILIKRSAFEKVSGFDEETYNYEDISFTKKIKKAFGYSAVKMLSQTVTTSARKFEKKGYSPFEFIINMLGFFTNRKIGQYRSNFWYGDPQVRNYKYMYLIFLPALLFFFDTLGLNRGFFSLHPLVEPAATLLIFTLLLMPLLTTFKAFLSIFILTIGIEALGLAYGIPFGNYVYNEGHALFGILGVPLFIGIAWYILIAGFAKVTNSAVATGIMVVLTDIIIEEFALIKSLWTWETTNSALVAPAQNYLTWFIIGIIGYHLVKKGLPRMLDSVLVLIVLIGHIATTLLFSGGTFWYGALGFLLIGNIFIQAFTTYVKNQVKIANSFLEEIVQ